MSCSGRWVPFTFLYEAGVHWHDRGIAAQHPSCYMVTIRRGKIGRRLRRIVKRARRRDNRTTP